MVSQSGEKYSALKKMKGRLGEPALLETGVLAGEARTLGDNQGELSKAQLLEIGPGGLGG